MLIIITKRTKLFLHWEHNYKFYMAYIVCKLTFQLMIKLLLAFYPHPCCDFMIIIFIIIDARFVIGFYDNFFFKKKDGDCNKAYRICYFGKIYIYIPSLYQKIIIDPNDTNHSFIVLIEILVINTVRIYFLINKRTIFTSRYFSYCKNII